MEIHLLQRQLKVAKPKRQLKDTKVQIWVTFSNATLGSVVRKKILVMHMVRVPPTPVTPSVLAALSEGRRDFLQPPDGDTGWSTCLP